MDPEQIDIESELEKARQNKLNGDQLNALAAALKTAKRLEEALEIMGLALEIMGLAKDQETQRADQERLAKDQETQRADRAERALAKDEDLSRRSIRNVFLNGEECSTGSWSYPRLQLEPDVSPSVEGHGFRNMGIQLATYVDDNVDEIGSGNKAIWNRLAEPGFLVVRALRDGKSLPSHFDRAETFRYTNEIGVQVLTNLVVKDVINCLNGKGRLEANMEVSLFGVTPDILVVTQDGKMVFVIEIKAPNREQTDDDVFNDGKVGGQIWLYLMMMKAAGIDNPLGAICTFNKIRIVSLGKMISHPFQKAREMLRKGDITQWESRQEEPKVANKLSPNPKLLKLQEKTEEYNVKKPWDLFPGHALDEVAGGVLVFNDAKLYGSKILENSLVFPALVLSLLTALIENNVIEGGQKETSLPLVEIDDNLSRRLYAWGTKDKITMAFTKQKCVVKRGDTTKATQFHLLGNIGQGKEAEVRLALTPSGRLSAIKFYHFKESREATADMRKKQNNERIKSIEEVRDTEYIRWKKLYPDRLVRKVTLAHRPCLQMVYGKPLSNDDRKKRFDEIEQELLRFFKNGFMYEKTDLRWRHVMKDHDDKIFLTDLSSLTDYSKTGLPNVVREDKNGNLFLVEKSQLDENDTKGNKCYDLLKKEIESFRGRGYQNNTSQTESTRYGIGHGNGSTPDKDQKNKRYHESAEGVSASLPPSAKKAKQETA